MQNNNDAFELFKFPKKNNVDILNEGHAIRFFQEDSHSKNYHLDKFFTLIREYEMNKENLLNNPSKKDELLHGFQDLYFFTVDLEIHKHHLTIAQQNIKHHSAYFCEILSHKSSKIPSL